MPVFQPSGQIKLTNVAIVRLRKGGKRFEVAAYKNKVLEWRSGIETDIDEVLQINNVFLNVSKGQAANTDDLQKCFNSTDRDAIVREILKKGEMQVGEKERSHKLDNTLKDICTIISSKCVDPNTKRPYTVSMIEKAMAELGFSLNSTKSAKSQALEAIKMLKERKIIPIERARMKLRITGPSKEMKKFAEKIRELADEIQDEDWSEEMDMVLFIDPGKYREITDLIQTETKGRGQVEVLDMAEADNRDIFT